MRYFEEVKVNDRVYGFIYGAGIVTYVLDEKFNMDGFYSFEVTFENQETVFYTKDGIPNWCNSDGCAQTIYYKDDIDLTEVDFTPSLGQLTPEVIMKLRVQNNLEIKCPSGIWRTVDECPEDVFLGAITKENYYMFREKK